MQVSETGKADITSRLNEASSLLDSGEVDKAISILQAVFKLDRGNIEARTLFGLCALKMGDVLTAEKNLRFVLKKAPDHFMAAYGLGLVAQMHGRTAEATQALEYAVERNAGFEPAREALAALKIPPIRSPRIKTTSHRGDLRDELVHPNYRLLRSFALVILTPVLLLLMLLVVAIFVEETVNEKFLLLGLIVLALGFITRAVRRSGAVTVRGIVRQLEYDTEERRRGKKIRGVRFRLETRDAISDRFPLIAVTFRGVVRPDEEVLVTGKPTKDNYFDARLIQVISTGEKIHPHK